MKTTMRLTQLSLVSKFLILTCLIGCTSSVRATSAAENWVEHCAKCHGARGKGDTMVGGHLKARDYSDPKVQASLKEEEMAKAITEGVVVEGKARMRAYSEFTPDEVKELIAHMLKFKAKAGE